MQAAFKSGWLLNETFLVCSWIYQTGALWHLILWKPQQILLGISHFRLWIYDSLICGSCKFGHFSQLQCCVNIWWYQKNFIKNLTVNYVSCVDKELFMIFNLLHEASDVQRAGNKPRALFPKFGTAVQSCIYCYPAGCSWVYFRAPGPVSYTHLTLPTKRIV